MLRKKRSNAAKNKYPSEKLNPSAANESPFNARRNNRPIAKAVTSNQENVPNTPDSAKSDKYPLWAEDSVVM